MATEIYLGNPPQYMIDWIKAHSKPAVKVETHIKFTDNSEGDYLIEGDMNPQALQNAGLIDNAISEPTWLKNPAEVNVGSAVTSIGDYVFLYCDGLTNVTIPDSVMSIGDYAFSGCGLTSITIPDSVISIGNQTFSACYNITNIMIGNNVTNIGNDAFANCDNLWNVTFSDKDNATVQGMANYSWGLNYGCVLHCTDGDITI